METKKVTVGEIIKALSEFPQDAPFEISISQYNKVHPVAYGQPETNPFILDRKTYGNMRDGVNVRLNVYLPSNNEEFMYTGIRKI